MEFIIGCPKSRLVWGIPCSPDVDCLVDAFGWLMAEVMDNHAFRANLPSQLTPFMKMAISRFEEMDLELEQTGLELRLFPVVLPVKAEEEPKADASVIEDQFLPELLEMDASTAVECMKAKGRLELLLEPRLWGKLAPARGSAQPPPVWFPGVKSQYVAYNRAVKHNVRPRCPLVRALAEYKTTDPSETAAVVHYLDVAMEQQDQQHEATRTHVTEQMKCIAPEVFYQEGDTKATILQSFREKESKLKHEKEAALYLFSRNAEKKRSRSARSSTEP